LSFFSSASACGLTRPVGKLPALTAVVGQECQQPAGAFVVGGIEDVSLDAPGPDQRCPLEETQVVGQRRRLHVQGFGDGPGREPVGSAADEQPEHRQPGLLRQCLKSVESLLLFHNSTIVQS